MNQELSENMIFYAGMLCGAGAAFIGWFITSVLIKLERRK